MQYQVIKVFNNNVVLAGYGGQQLLIISKGIGFSKKAGEQIDLDSLDADKRVFHILDESDSASDYSRISRNFEQLERITRQIVDMARTSLGIEAQGLYDALFDHISFSVERLRVGLPIENPFVTEISILCREEYPIAQSAANLIREQMDVAIGEAEIGFIALHLYSARKQKPVKTAMKSVRIYKQALEILSRSFQRDFNRNDHAVRLFLMSLSTCIYCASKGRRPGLPLKSQLTLQLGRSCQAAHAISEFIEKELGLQFSEDETLYLALDIHRLIQS